LFRISDFGFRIFRRCLPLVRDGAWIGLLAAALVLLYAHNDFVPIPGLARRAERLPEGPARTALVWAAERCYVLNEIGYPVLYQIRHNRESQGGVCPALGLGPEPYLGYFPLALSMKLTAGLLLLTAALALLRARALANAAGLAAVAILLFCLTGRIQIGVRLALPVAALLAVAAAAAWAGTLAGSGPARRRLLAGAAAAAVGWGAAADLRAWPDGLGYLNEFWGGPANAARYLSDSNYDWGQGLFELRRWQKDQGVASVNVWYFGHPWALADYPYPCRRLSLERLPLDGPGGLCEQVSGDWLAVSATLLHGSGDSPAAVYLRRQRPAAQTRTMTIYDFRRGAPPAGP
jgi:hypothetical protein